MDNPEAHELIRTCHTISGKIDDLQSELEEAEEEMQEAKQKLRKLLDETGSDHLIVRGYGMNYKIFPSGKTLARISIATN